MTMFSLKNVLITKKIFLLLDQTPTPTKFLKTCEEIGLFQELSSNPFDHAYKKALDSDVSFY